MSYRVVKKVFLVVVSAGLLVFLSAGWALFLLQERERMARWGHDTLKSEDTPDYSPASPFQKNGLNVSSEADLGPVAGYTHYFSKDLDYRPTVDPATATITVGPENADLVGSDDRVIQAGLDLLERQGGGTLHILAGVYTLRNTVVLRENVDIIGSGLETVFQKSEGLKSKLVQDADWYESAVVIADPSGFTPGAGIMIHSHRLGPQGPEGNNVTKTTVTEVEGQTVYLRDHLEKDHRILGDAVATNTFPLLTGNKIKNVRVANLVLDGNGGTNSFMDGNFVGAVFLTYCNDFTFRNVIARTYNGDGFSIQVCSDIRLENCSAENNANLGFHPGSGSARVTLASCNSTGNGQGVYFCWGVTQTLLEDCTISRNQTYGVNIGYRDTDNVVRNCRIEENGLAGVFFPGGREDFGGGHRNVIDSCRIVDNGSTEPGIGILIQAHHHDLALVNNYIGNTGTVVQATGIRVHPDAAGIVIEGNHFENMTANVDSLQPWDERAKELMGR